MAEPLTQLEQRVYHYMIDFLAENTYQPSIREIAREYVAAHFGDAAGNDPEQIRRFAVEYLRKEQDLDLRAFGVKFDSYFLESSRLVD